MVLMFREAERNRKWFIQIWDRARADNREREALRLVESIEDCQARDSGRVHLALSLISERSAEGRPTNGEPKSKLEIIGHILK